VGVEACFEGEDLGCGVDGDRVSLAVFQRTSSERCESIEDPYLLIRRE
jgi:hypothetical protein